MDPLSRRDLLATAAVAGLAATTRSTMAREAPLPRGAGDLHRGPAVIASGNGVRAVERALAMIREGSDPAVAIVEGVGIVEADPKDMSVGLGGLPNEEGVVQLDSCVMHGPTHKAGSVACLEDTLHPAAVALKVLQTTDHVMLVGEGAKRFARAHGFPHHDMLTPEAREVWLRWKRNHDPNDDWLDDDQSDWDREGKAIQRTTGTIHCSAVTAAGDLAGCTTTSGLSYKIPGRVGDSPIIGAGNYTDNDVGSAGATGRGEAVIQTCGAFAVVQAMGRGLEPTEACFDVLRLMAKKAVLQKRHRNAAGEPNFNVSLYAMRKDGAWGSASLRKGGSFAIADGEGARRIECAYLYE